VSEQIIEGFVGKVFNLIEDEETILNELEEKRRQTQAKTEAAIINAVRELWPQLNGKRGLQEWTISYLYWNVPKIAVGTMQQLFSLKHILPLVQQHQLHGLNCERCGDTLYCNSRTDMKTFVSSHPVCDKCRDAEHAERYRETERIQVERLRRSEELRAMPYKEYLQTPEWASMRIRMLKRAGFRCQLCNREGKLNVHHRTYERRGNEDYADLIVLCGNCHAKFHDKLVEE